MRQMMKRINRFEGVLPRHRPARVRFADFPHLARRQHGHLWRRHARQIASFVEWEPVSHSSPHFALEAIREWDSRSWLSWLAERVCAIWAKPIRPLRKIDPLHGVGSRLAAERPYRYMEPMAKTSHQRVTERRAKLRASGLRPIQIWVPDTRTPGFAEERQCRLIAEHISVGRSRVAR
jgi:hypothetical protein